MKLCSSGKESPVLIGKSKKPAASPSLRIFPTRVVLTITVTTKHGCALKFMIGILTKLKNRVKIEGRNILMFLENVPCHPQELKGMFSNIRVGFLAKNTTLLTQPLDAGIIKTWKVYYRRKLLRYNVCCWPN